MANIIGFIICLLVYIAAGIFSTLKVLECTYDIFQMYHENFELKAPLWSKILVWALLPVWMAADLLILIGYLIYAIYKVRQARKEYHEFIKNNYKETK